METLLRHLRWGAKPGRKASLSRVLPAAKAEPAPSLAGPDSAMAERRIAVLRNMFPSLFSWVANRAQLANAREVHDYLAEATNLADLEQRIRLIERQRHFS